MGERRLTTKGIVFFGALTVFLLLLHAADEIVGPWGTGAGQVGGAAGLFAILVPTVWVFGLGWTWKERKLGYVIVLVLSPIAFLGFLLHPFALGGQTSLEGIAAAYTLSGAVAVGVFMVFALLAFGLTSLTTFLLSIYALAVPKRE